MNERSAEILVSPGEARNGYGKYEIPVRRDETNEDHTNKVVVWRAYNL